VLEGDDKSQTYSAGSNFWVHLNTTLPKPDSLTWQISNFGGTTIATGTVAVGMGTSSVVVPCVANSPGYFTVTVKLQKASVMLPQKGSRPAGFASFGVLPDFSSILPKTQSAALEKHWFGLQGTNFLESGKLEVGTGLQPVNQNLGSSMVIDSRSWRQMEPQFAGQYNPATIVIDLGFRQGNLMRMVRLDGIPAWASASPSPATIGSFPPKSYAAFQAYTSKVAQETSRQTKTYIPQQGINYYQVTWEPDTGNVDKWMGSDEDFVSLYKAAWQGVHSGDPAAAVIGPATSTISASISWLTRLSALGFGNYIDAVGIHGYYRKEAGVSYAPEDSDLPQQMQELRHTVATLLPTKTKLLVTETGIAYPPGSKYSATYPTTDALRQHAENVVRAHLILLGEGADASFLFYSADYLSEVGFGLYFNLAMQTVDFGSPDISPKPAAMAVAAMTRIIDGTKTLGAVKQMPANAYGYSFELNDATHVITALWVHDATSAANVPFSFTIDNPGTSGSVTIVDGMGNANVQQYSDGKLQTTLTEMPAYVISSNIAAITPQLRTPEGF
jgi:hypothetical protein